MKPEKQFLFLTVLFPLVIFSCSSYEQMLEEFDDKFSEKPHVNSSVSLSESEASSKRMLSPNKYEVYETANLILRAPDDGEEYIWSIGDEVIANSQILSYSLPGLFSRDGNNVLTLTVKTKSGKVCTDTAKIIFK